MHIHIYVCSVVTLFTDNHVVVHQSDTKQVLRKNLQVLPIFCIASTHSVKTEYEWFRESESIGVCSPVLYVIRVGTYQCRVTTDDGKSICTSLNIEVVSGIHIYMYM